MRFCLLKDSFLGSLFLFSSPSPSPYFPFWFCAPCDPCDSTLRRRQFMSDLSDACGQMYEYHDPHESTRPQQSRLLTFASYQLLQSHFTCDGDYPLYLTHRLEAGLQADIIHSFGNIPRAPRAPSTSKQRTVSTRISSSNIELCKGLLWFITALEECTRRVLAAELSRVKAHRLRC